MNTNTRNLLAWFLVLCLCVWWISYYGGVFPYTCFYLVLFFPLVCAANLLYQMQTIRLYQEIPDRRPKRRDLCDYTLTLENTGILPIEQLELTIMEDLCTMEHFEGREPIHLRPGQRRVLKAELTCLYAGTYPIGVRSYRMTDCFHMFHREISMGAEFRAMVQPAVSECAEPFISLLNERNNLNHPNRKLLEDIPGSELRSYRPGDEPRRIHWKNSARLGELLIRLPDPIDLQNFVLLPRLVIAERTDSLEFVRRRDRFLEQLVSAAWIFAREARPVRIYYPCGRYDSARTRFQEFLVDSFESFDTFYTKLIDMTDQAIDPGEEGYASIQRRVELDGDLLLELLEEQAEGGSAGWKC